MAQLWIVFAFSLLITTVCVLGEDLRHHVSTLGDSVSFSASDHCGYGEDFTFTRRLKDDSSKCVGAVVKGDWVPGEDYKDRVKHLSNTPVRLYDVTINDKGTYEFFCGGRFVPVQLDVIVPNNVRGTEGETVKLRYYFSTLDKHNVEFIWWEKNGKRVCGLNVSSGEVKYGTEFEGRVSVSPDWFSRGDLSLNLERAQPEDEGDFIIYEENKDRRKKIAVVRLEFKEKNAGQIACTPLNAPPPQSCPEEKGMPTLGVVLITVAVMIVVFALGLFGWWLKSR